MARRPKSVYTACKTAIPSVCHSITIKGEKEMEENKAPVIEPILSRDPAPDADPGKKPPRKPLADPAWLSGADATSYPASCSYVEDLEAEVLTAEKPGKKKALFIGLGCLLLALLAAGGWWLLNRLRTDPLRDLKLAANKSLNSYLDYVKDLPNLHQYTENLRAFTLSDNKHIDLNVTLEGTPQGADFAFQLSADRDGDAKKTLLHGSYTSSGMTIPVDLYLDREQLQLGSSSLLNAGEALALPTKDLGKKWNDSNLAKTANTKLPDGLSLSFLAEGLTDRSMRDTFGDDWSDFVRSVSYRQATEADGPSYFIGSGEVYVLSWDQDLLTKLGNRAKSITSSFNENPQTDKLLPAAAVSLLHELSRSMEAPKFLIVDGMLTGISLQEKTEEADKEIVRIELVGESNPWSRSVIDRCRWNSAAQKLETEESIICSNTVADGRLLTKVTQTAEDGSITAEMESVYYDADGSLSFSGSGDFTTVRMGDRTLTDAQVPDLTESFLDSASYRMVPTDGGVQIEESFDLGASTGNSFAPLTGRIQISATLSTKTAAIQPLSKEPTQLLELDQTNLGVLFMRIYSKISGKQPFGSN